MHRFKIHFPDFNWRPLPPPAAHFPPSLSRLIFTNREDGTKAGRWEREGRSRLSDVQNLWRTVSWEFAKFAKEVQFSAALKTAARGIHWGINQRSTDVMESAGGSGTTANVRVGRSHRRLQRVQRALKGSAKILAAVNMRQNTTSCEDDRIEHEVFGLWHFNI